MKLIILSWRFWVGSLSTVLVSACNTLPPSSNADAQVTRSSHFHEVTLSGEASVLLSESQADFSALLKASQQMLTAQASYFSASKKTCRNISLTPSEQVDGKHYIACQRKGGQWYLNRPLP